MIYRIVHRTTYNYRYPVSVGTHVACLKPRALPHHQLSRSELRIQPRPATRTERVDFFGNVLCFFTIREPHMELVVEARSGGVRLGVAAHPCKAGVCLLCAPVVYARAANAGGASGPDPPHPQRLSLRFESDQRPDAN